jgi:hypothetical protein
VTEFLIFYGFISVTKAGSGSKRLMHPVSEGKGYAVGPCRKKSGDLIRHPGAVKKTNRSKAGISKPDIYPRHKNKLQGGKSWQKTVL